MEHGIKMTLTIGYRHMTLSIVGQDDQIFQYGTNEYADIIETLPLWDYFGFNEYDQVIYGTVIY